MESQRVSLVTELEEVAGELAVLEEDIEKLLQRQEVLRERQSLLQVQLSSLDRTEEESEAKRQQAVDWEDGRFPWTDELHSKLAEVFGLQQFRPLQLSCINATLSKKDVLMIMPTGGGKSLCYQLPALLSPGFTLVISPLVALMEDQLMAVKRFGIESAMLNASSSKDEVNRVHSAMTDKAKDFLKLLYVTPEKIAKSKRFMSKLEKAYEMDRLSRIVIDEVHCVSQWGHDFRPDFKILGIMKRQFPESPILGLTATATSKVLEDCKDILSLGRNCMIVKASYNRPNLYYKLIEKPATRNEQLDIIANLIKQQFVQQSGIVYCLSQKETEQVSLGLSQVGISAGCYHANMIASDRTRVHTAWISNKIQVIVATIAFGMGIDKADVRFIIHHTVSKSMENYYQESGRAGRDGNPAYCILLYRSPDAFRQSTMVFQEHTGLRNLYNMLRYCLNSTECRRALIARHFGEQWKAADCDRMCDVCDSIASSSVTQDKHTSVTDYSAACQVFINVLEESKGKDQRLTALKMMELSKRKDKLTAFERDQVLVHCILEGILKEEFHFTPYSTISYVALGRKSAAVKSGHLTVSISCRPMTIEQNSTSQSTGNSPSTSGLGKSRKRKKSPSAQKCRSGKCPALKSPNKQMRPISAENYDSDDDFLNSISSGKRKQKASDSPALSSSISLVILDSDSSD